MQKKNWLSLLAASASALVLTVGFENCSKSNFSDSSSSSSTVADAATGSSCTGILCGIRMSDINYINFTGVVSSSRVGSYTLEIDTAVDSASETLVSNLTGTISTKLTGNYTFVTCATAGTNVDFNALQSNLSAVTFSSVQNPSVTKFASAQLNIVLKNGTTKNYLIDTSTSSVSVSGLKSVNAGALVSQLEAMVIKSSCSASLP